MDTDGILCYHCLTKHGELTDSFDLGIGEVECSAHLNNSVAKWRQQLVEMSSRLEHIRSNEGKRQQREEEEKKTAALLQKQWEQDQEEHLSNQASADKVREFDEEMESTEVLFLYLFFKIYYGHF